MQVSVESIRGYADCIGEENTNLTLSMNRANAVKSALEESLKRAGRSDVTFDVYGYGENQSSLSFSNTLPEERFYNRTAIVDITVKKVNLASTSK